MGKSGFCIFAALLLAACAPTGNGGERNARQATYSQPRDVVWQAVKGVLGAEYEVVEEYQSRGVMHTDWRFETVGDRAYRSRVSAWVSGVGRFRVEFEVEMYVRAVAAPSDMRMPEGERQREDELYRALYRRLEGIAR